MKKIETKDRPKLLREGITEEEWDGSSVRQQIKEWDGSSVRQQIKEWDGSSARQQRNVTAAQQDSRGM
jgi:hypothetical protein